jgi:hypothetical protein
MLEGIRDARTQLKEVQTLIRDVKDTKRRAELEQLAEEASAPLVQATESGHAFVFDRLQERLDAARAQIAALREQVANPR